MALHVPPSDIVMRKHLIQILLSLAVAFVFLGHAAKIFDIPLISTLDRLIYDTRLRATMPGTVEENIVILDIDERSLAEVGRWPWNRKKMARLMDRLFDDYRIAILGLDAIFAEREESSGMELLEKLANSEWRNNRSFRMEIDRLRPDLDHDKLFAESLRNRRVVLGYSFTNNAQEFQSGQLPEPAVSPGTFAGRNVSFTQWNGYGASLPELMATAAGAGHLNPLMDFDGVTRRLPMLVEYNGNHYEALSLAMARILLGNPLIVPGFDTDWSSSITSRNGLDWLDLATQDGSVRLPIDENAAALIPFRGHQSSFRYVSAADALAGRLPVEQLRDKIVIMGTSTPALADLRATPVGSGFPGVEIHANMLAGILEGTLIEKPPHLIGTEILLVFACGTVLALFLPFISPLLATLLALGLVTTAITYNLYLWSSGIAMPGGTVLLTIAFLYAQNMAWGYFVETRRKRQLADCFGQYVPPELVDKMAHDPERYSMEGRKEELTVMFSDVRDFTSISEGLDSKELVLLMNTYLDAMTHVIQRHRGTLDKYIGDAIMAFWGAPVSDAEHARNAVRAALEMRAALQLLAPQFREKGWPLLQIGIGINTGAMTVGDMGSPIRRAYTVMGDTVNLGSRLEGLTKHYGVGIIVTETTALQAPEFAYRELDRVRVKGKGKDVRIFEPLCPLEALDAPLREELGVWSQTLNTYRERDWIRADSLLDTLLAKQPECSLYLIYRERIEEFRRIPPPDDWDGITSFTTK